MPRVEIPVIGPAYKSRELPLSAQVSKNLWPEVNKEGRNIVALHHVWGLAGFGNVTGKNRGLTQMNGVLYGVNGTTFYSMDDQGRHRTLGTVTGSNRCVFANDGTQMIIVTGDTPYIYTVAAGLQAITDPDLTKPTSVAYLNTQFILDNNRGVRGEFVTTDVSATFNVNALNFATAQSHPDDILRVLVFNQYVYFFGSRSIEPWYNSGSGNPPFARVNNGIRPYGIAGIHAVGTTQQFIYFLDEKRVPRRMSQFEPVSIGIPPMGVEWGGYGKIDDCIVQTYIQDQQQFVAFIFPDADRTWVYHEDSNSWFQMADGVGDSRHRLNAVEYLYGWNIVADHSDGSVYVWDSCVFQNNGKAMQRQRDTAVIHGGLYQAPGKQLFFDQVEFILAVGECRSAGLGPGPQPEVIQGICAASTDLTQGELLNVTGLQRAVQSLVWTTPDANGYDFADTKVVSFTAAFIRGGVPVAGSAKGRATLIEILGASAANRFTVYMDTNGYIKIEGANSSSASILDVTITNNGASFADEELYFLACVIDLSSTDRREVWLNASDITDNTNYVTWNTYTDDFIELADNGTAKTYYFAANNIGGFGLSGSDPNNVNSFGFISFDDSCSLLCEVVWDRDGYVSDPGKWEGWYKTQPWVFCPSLYRNTGRAQPAAPGTGYEANGDASETSSPDFTNTAIVNLGVGGTTEAIFGSPLPTPLTVSIEAVAPLWENLTGAEDTVTLANYPTVEWEAWTGNEYDLTDSGTWFWPPESVSSLGGPDATALTSNRAVRILASDKITHISFLSDPGTYTDAALVLTDSSGNIINYAYTVDNAIERTGSGVASSGLYYGTAVIGPGVRVPGDGGEYYLVAVSNTTAIKIGQWVPSL